MNLRVSSFIEPSIHFAEHSSLATFACCEVCGIELSLVYFFYFSFYLPNIISSVARSKEQIFHHSSTIQISKSISIISYGFERKLRT